MKIRNFEGDQSTEGVIIISKYSSGPSGKDESASDVPIRRLCYAQRRRCLSLADDSSFGYALSHANSAQQTETPNVR